VAEGDFVILHGRYSGHGLPLNWIVADIVRLKDGMLVEHWDVIQDEAICEFGMRDEDVTRITRRAADAQRHTLMDTLRRAQMEGELDAQTDLESLADFFESTLAGIRIAAKAGKTRPALRRIVEVASGTFADVKSSVL
jgi:hypothetical protein